MSAQDNNDGNPPSVIARAQGTGMEPKSIIIGDRLKHTVHNGALMVPTAALKLMQHSSPLKTADETFELPSVDSVLRPTMDNTPITVTYLRNEVFSLPQPPAPEGQQPAPPTQLLRTVATNRTWNPPGEQPDRIRGGGDEEAMKPPASAPAPGAPPAQAPAPAVPFGQAHAQPVAPAAAPPTGQPIVTSIAPSKVPPSAHMDVAAAAPRAIQPAPQPAKQPEIRPIAAIPSQPTQVAASTTPVPATSLPTPTVPAVTVPLTQPPTQPVPTKSAPPITVSSSATTAPPAKPVAAAPVASATNVVPAAKAVVGLAKVPTPQYKQHIPGPNDEMQVEIKNARPSWYKSDGVSEIERSLMPEWFDESAQHRTAESFIKAREQVLRMSTQLGNRFITTTLIRRTVPGDAGSLSRLFQFLVSYGMINADSINDSTPTSSAIRGLKKRARPTKFQDKLADIVLKKHRKEGAAIDWQVVADQIGDGATALDCQKGFLGMDLGALQPSTTTTERSITPDPDGSEKPASADGRMIAQILESTDDKVLAQALETALKQSDDLSQARDATVAAALVSKATEKARTAEQALGLVLAELNEKRMRRLEKRIELLNDIEGMMEAERMALELERRDLYTARCRHWFGGDS